MKENKDDYWGIQLVFDFLLMIVSSSIIFISPFHSFGLDTELVAFFMFIIGIKFLLADWRASD